MKYESTSPSDYPYHSPKIELGVLHTFPIPIPPLYLASSLQGKETSFFKIILDFRTFVSTENPIPPQYLQREKIFSTDLEVNEIL